MEDFFVNDPFNTNSNCGVGAGLSNVQFWENGEPLNSHVKAENEFDTLDADDEDNFLG